MVAIQCLQPNLYDLGPAASIPFGEGRAYRVGSHDVAVFRSRTGEIFATQAACPHKDGPLADGIVGGGRVICPLHAYTFDLASGRPVSGACEGLRVYEVAVSADGNISLRLDE